MLLQEGIGDTIRVSLTPQPGEARTQEVVVALEILQSLGPALLQPERHRLPRLRPHHQHDLPGAGQADRRLPARADAGVEGDAIRASRTMKVAVMGCIVNGPGESKHADIGISLPGTGEAPAAPVFIDGEKALTLRGDGIAHEFQALVENYIEKRFGAAAATPLTLDLRRAAMIAAAVARSAARTTVHG